MSEYTKGPWRMVHPRSGLRDIGIMADGCANVLAEVFEEFHAEGIFSAPETEANARIICAAPELLEALGACDGAFAGWQVGGIPGRPEDILALIVKVRAAIAKAKGKP